MIDTLSSRLKDEFPNINIENLYIERPENLPDDFFSFKLKEILILTMRNGEGNLRALYMTGNNTSKSMYFKFKIRAKIPVYVALKDMQRNHILNISDYEKQEISIDNYDKNALVQIKNPSAYVTKTKINKGKILTNLQFKTINDIKKGDQITVIIKDGSLSVQSMAMALQSGNIGDTITVRSDTNQILKATIISKTKAIVR